jgi:hypothetical protein
MNPLDLLTDFLLAAVNSPWVYLVVFAVVVIDGFFPPVPRPLWFSPRWGPPWATPSPTDSAGGSA